MLGKFEKCFSLLVIEAVAGIIIIAFFFNVLSNISPSAYRFLTKWANQSLLPVAQTCTIELIPSKTSELVKSFKKYKIKISFEEFFNLNSSILVYNEDSIGISKNKNENCLNEEACKNYLILRPLNNNFIEFYAFTQSHILNPDVLKYENCPFKTVIIKD